MHLSFETPSLTRTAEHFIAGGRGKIFRAKDKIRGASHNSGEEEREGSGSAWPQAQHIMHTERGRERGIPLAPNAHPRSMPTTIDKDNYCRESLFGFYFPGSKFQQTDKDMQQ